MRLIDADTLKKEMCKSTCNVPLTRMEVCGKVCREQRIIDNAPTVEAEPVRHGHWIEKDWVDGDTYYDCSACGHSWVTIEGTPQDNEMNYCPYCGAHMDEVSE